MINSKKPIFTLSSVIVWNCLFVVLELVVLGFIEASFLRGEIESFSETTLNQHLTSQEPTLERAVASMSDLMAADIGDGLLETGHFDRVEIFDDFGRSMNVSIRDIQPTFYSRVAENIFGISITEQITHSIETPWGGEGKIFVRANLVGFSDSLMRDILARSFFLGLISLLISLSGTSFLVSRIQRGANALGDLATDIAENKTVDMNKKRNFYFVEFSFLAQHLETSINQLMHVHAQLQRTTLERKNTEDSYHLTLQSLNIHTKFISVSGEILFSSFEGLNVKALKIAFRERKSDLKDYVAILNNLQCDFELLSHQKFHGEIVMEQMKLRVVEEDASWLVQISKLDDGRLLITCSDVSEVRLSDQRHFHNEKNEALGRISSNVAHEFNNMLNIILNSVEAAQAQDPTERKDDLFDTALIAGQRAKQVVNRLQQLSRDQALHLVNIDVKSWIDNSIMLLKAVVGPSVEIEFKCDASPVIIADASALDASLINLCKNSSDAMAGPGKISITIEQHNSMEQAIPVLNSEMDYVHIRFRDTGPGILPIVQKKIFEPYFTTKEYDKGTGLGLSEVKNMISAMNGDISLNPQYTSGAEFNIYLERGTKSQIDPKKRMGLSQPLPEAGMSVLIVEDEGLLSQLWSQFLSALGMTVFTFSTLAQAKDFLRNEDETIDVALLDNTLPDGFGVELLPEIRKVHPRCRCISISGESDLVHIEDFDKYAVKPVALSQLRSLVALGALSEGGPKLHAV